MPTVHASAIALGEDGVLVRGAPGSGKSTLALALVEAWRRDGRFARLVGDDRVVLDPHGGRCVVRAAAPLAGLVEVRGAGILRADHLEAARLTLVVDLSEAPPRLPEAADESCLVAGIALARLCLAARSTVASVLAVSRVLRPDGLTWQGQANQRPVDLSRTGRPGPGGRTKGDRQ